MSSPRRRVVTLRGGTRDGEKTEVYSFQPMIYMMLRLTMEEHKELQIDDSIAWKPPEEVYVKDEDNVYTYDRTVHYKP